MGTHTPTHTPTLMLVSGFEQSPAVLLPVIFGVSERSTCKILTVHVLVRVVY